MKIKKIILATLFLPVAVSSFACDCHDGTANFSGAFGGFSGWQLPSAACNPSHTTTTTSSPSAEGTDLVEDVQEPGVEGSLSESDKKPLSETST